MNDFFLFWLETKLKLLVLTIIIDYNLDRQNV